MKIAKEYKWEMGHRLTFHKGGCENLHGHSYKMLVEISGDKDENGMLLDYFDLDKMINPLTGELDHGFIVYNEDIVLIEFMRKINSKMTVVPFQPTAENLCGYLIDKIKKQKLPSNIKTLRVRVSETEDVFAEEIMEV